MSAAPMMFVLLWSTGFIGAKYGLPYVEPFTFLSLRMGFVVALHVLIVWLWRVRWPTATEAKHSAITGLLVHGVYLGGVFLAIKQGVPAGISALIPGLQPILMSTIANRWLGERVSKVQWAGLALGLVGVALGAARPQHDRLRHAARLGGELRLADRHHARHALSEAPQQQHRLAQRQSGAIRGGGRVLRADRLHLRDARDRTGPASLSSRWPGWCW